jgi:adenylate cyclase
MNYRFYFMVFAYWIIGTNLSTLFLLSGVEAYLEILQIDQTMMPDVLTGYLLSYHQYAESTLFAILFAALFLFIHHLSEKKEYGRMSFGRIILIKSIVYILGFTVIFLIIYGVSTTFIPQSKESISYVNWTPITIRFTGTYLLILISQIALLNFIIQADKTFGQSKLRNFLTGKYHMPLVEDRVFLFIDLKDSTTYAEELGNIKYSMLIKDCFADLNTLVRSHKAEIYQYVGDEVVITWPTENTISTPYCIDFYFAFRELLASRNDYYQQKYGLSPKFKAGANGGHVTATEIGDVKRDIAYHGDVLNTAARIQAACNEYQQSFMITESLLNKLSGINHYNINHIGAIQLKGKHDETDVYAIKKVVS